MKDAEVDGGSLEEARITLKGYKPVTIASVLPALALSDEVLAELLQTWDVSLSAEVLQHWKPPSSVWVHVLTTCDHEAAAVDLLLRAVCVEEARDLVSEAGKSCDIQRLVRLMGALRRFQVPGPTTDAPAAGVKTAAVQAFPPTLRHSPPSISTQDVKTGDGPGDSNNIPLPSDSLPSLTPSPSKGPHLPKTLKHQTVVLAKGSKPPLSPSYIQRLFAADARPPPARTTPLIPSPSSHPVHNLPSDTTVPATDRQVSDTMRPQGDENLQGVKLLSDAERVLSSNRRSTDEVVERQQPVARRSVIRAPTPSSSPVPFDDEELAPIQTAPMRVVANEIPSFEDEWDPMERMEDPNTNAGNSADDIQKAGDGDPPAGDEEEGEQPDEQLNGSESSDGYVDPVASDNWTWSQEKNDKKVK
ncbi:hypothetical protein FRC01_011938, partial [Tulasnella sp. 417]